MKVVPLFSDSLGVRSMATYVETRDCKILIDPSAALADIRFGLHPSHQEEAALTNAKQTIARLAETSTITVVSHYHYDHYDPMKYLYKNKTVYAKDIYTNINQSQQKRGTELKETMERFCIYTLCDNQTYTIGNTTITFSPAFPHGPEHIRLGYVLMTTVDDGTYRVLHTSDVQGPVFDSAKDYILNQHPDLLIVDGPPTMFLGYRFSKKNLDAASGNLVEIITRLKGDIILDHHLLRDTRYQHQFPEPYHVGGNRVKTFAEYLGKKNNTLEARRKELWEGEP
jgi:predicted metallo-beta-lactamase superfamily hydrolase